MGSRKGSLLEKEVQSILESAGFETERNKFVKGYEVDIFAKVRDSNVIIECKQYEQSNLSVRNLIHEWKGKNKYIGADIIVLAIYGQKITDEEKKLAEENNLVIWDEKKLDSFLTMNEDKYRDYILEELTSKLKSLGESYEWPIKQLVWEPYLKNKDTSAKRVQGNFYNWLKKRIRRKLREEGSNKTERQSHITFFEHFSEDGLIRSNIDVKSDSKRYKMLVERLEDNDNEFDSDRIKEYIEYVNSLNEELDSAKDYYLNSEGREQLSRLIHSRIIHTNISGIQASFEDFNQSPTIEVCSNGSLVVINVGKPNKKDEEELKWVLTREGINYKIEEKDQRGNINTVLEELVFVYYDIEEATDAIIRVFDEYYEKELDELCLTDKYLLNYKKKYSDKSKKNKLFESIFSGNTDSIV